MPQATPSPLVHEGDRHPFAATGWGNVRAASGLVPLSFAGEVGLTWASSTYCPLRGGSMFRQYI